MRATKFFIFGFLAAAGALAVELLISNIYFIFSGQEIFFSYFEKITAFLVLVVIIEESFKYMMCMRLYRLDPKHSFIDMIAAGAGFSSIESYLALLNNAASQEMSRLLLSVGGTLLLHIAAFGLIIYQIFSKKRTAPLQGIMIILLASLVHFTYNMLVIYDFSHGAIYAYLAAIFILLFILRMSSKKLASG